jgi:hypothetical protein
MPEHPTRAAARETHEAEHRIAADALCAPPGVHVGREALLETSFVGVGTEA